MSAADQVLNEFAARRGVTLAPMGVLLNGATIWACMGDCCCWFVIDGDSVDRFSLVNEGGWCQGQSCPCHDLPLATLLA